jgi:hypothetical protein
LLNKYPNSILPIQTVCNNSLIVFVQFPEMR